MTPVSTNDFPSGDVQFFDAYSPALTAGPWRISVSQALTGVDTGPLGADQEVLVSAPQFSVDAAAVLNQYPPAGTTGNYAHVLPHLILSDPSLPWERAMTPPPGTSTVPPWLALVVLTDSDIVGGAGSPTRGQTSTVSALLGPDGGVLGPTVTPEADVDPTDPITVVQLTTAAFAAVLPRLTDTPYLAHARQSTIADKAALGLAPSGLCAAIVANRFPPAATGTNATPTRCVAHLVSVEGFETYLTDDADLSAYTSVLMASLTSWTFNTLPEAGQSFSGLAENLVAAEYDGTAYTPANLWLRLPTAVSDAREGSPAATKVADRLAAGYVPSAYHLRTGEDTLAWYRGPGTPILPTPMPAGTHFPTSDAALVYDSATGVFDASLAAAWQAGRAAALADRSFGQSLLSFRRRGHALTDALLYRLDSDLFSATQISHLAASGSVADAFLSLMRGGLVDRLAASAPARTVAGAGSGSTPDPEPQTAVKDFLADPDVQAVIADEVAHDLQPVATWLGRLSLLYPLPFGTIVPDTRMMPPESVRFFYVDPAWVSAAMDGALSLGTQSSRDSLFTQAMSGVVRAAAGVSAAAARARLIGVDPPTSDTAPTQVCGMLLHSGLVAAWPNLAVQGLTSAGDTLKVLRLDQLSGDVLLCLWWGIPDAVILAEPPEGIRFGVDDAGNIPLRQPTAGEAPPLGTQIGPPVPLDPAHLRPGGTGVLDIGDAVTAVTSALTAAGHAMAAFGTADFALQMVLSPEAVRFTISTPGTSS